MSTQNYAGIDIAKRHFVIGIHGRDKTKTETNNPKASRSPHIQPIACVATPHTLPVNHAELQNQNV